MSTLPEPYAQLPAWQSPGVAQHLSSLSRPSCHTPPRTLLTRADHRPSDCFMGTVRLPKQLQRSVECLADAGSPAPCHPAQGTRLGGTREPTTAMRMAHLSLSVLEPTLVAKALATSAQAGTQLPAGRVGSIHPASQSQPSSLSDGANKLLVHAIEC